jgi:RNA polymerase sigma-70 factor (ECF subfamily)
MDTGPDPDSDLVERSRQGDASALRELLHANARLIQSVAARLTRNPQLQEDIFQEVVMRVIRKISEFRGNCKFSTWVYRITVNVTFSMLSREGVHKNALGLDEVAEQLSGGEHGIEDTIDQKRMFKEAVSVIMGMPQNNREVFSMFYLADASLDEIAKQTGKSQNAIKAILFKGRKLITRHLRRNGMLSNV